jgi:hypothetical protein
MAGRKGIGIVCICAFCPPLPLSWSPDSTCSPTWTAAVFFATRQLNNASEPEMIDRDRKRTTEPEILDPGPAPGAEDVRQD